MPVPSTLIVPSILVPVVAVTGDESAADVYYAAAINIQDAVAGNPTVRL